MDSSSIAEIINKSDSDILICSALDENIENYKAAKAIGVDQLKAARERVKDLNYTQHLQ